MDGTPAGMSAQIVRPGPGVVKKSCAANFAQESTDRGLTAAISADWKRPRDWAALIRMLRMSSERSKSA
jgi:hypothetical protein